MHRSGSEEQLSPGQIALLRLFLASPRKVLTRDDIMAAAPAESADAFDRSIDSRIVRLRRKLDTESITTIRGAGYRFDPPRSSIESAWAELKPGGRPPRLTKLRVYRRGIMRRRTGSDVRAILQHDQRDAGDAKQALRVEQRREDDRSKFRGLAMHGRNPDLDGPE